MHTPIAAPVTTIEWRDDGVRFLDQTLLPSEENYVQTDDYRVIADAIIHLRLRGAPLIGIAAAYGVALAARHSGQKEESAVKRAVTGAIDTLRATRPTAVNLFEALSRMERLLVRGPGGPDLPDRLLAEARSIHTEDEKMCLEIGANGADLIPDRATVITHCNAGALATGGIGTALGVIVTAVARGRRVNVYADETRPLFQGARLTAWELTRAGIPVTVITDSTAPSLMRGEKIDAVIIGADRISRNGDVANKIGSYGLALAASAHAIPFYVAAPSTTVDPGSSTGADIPIEERERTEISEFAGRMLVPSGAGTRAPAFDVTPARFVSAIITDRGVHRPPYDFGTFSKPSTDRAGEPG
jgi:methylthioribose-1-phosphate isomerase